MSTIIEITFVTLVLIIVLANLVLLNYQKKYEKITNETNLSGFEIVCLITNNFTHKEPHIIKKRNWPNLDYYDNERNVVKLSPNVFDDQNLYASLMAYNVSLETLSSNIKINFMKKLVNFLILIFYFLLIIGALANNYAILNLSFILFIITFLINLIYISLFLNNIKTNNELTEFLNKEPLIKPKDHLANYSSLFILVTMAKLPYNFLTYFL